MEQKFLRVTFSNGEQWDIPATVIAEDRAKYYSNKEGTMPKEKAEIFKEEMSTALSDDYEITDWAANNMNWDDVKEHAVMVEIGKKIDYADEWTNADTEVIEK